MNVGQQSGTRFGNVQSSVDASPSYPQYRQQQIRSPMAAPKSFGRPQNPSVGAYGKALASLNQNAASQRMAENNLATTLAGQDARSKDAQNLATLFRDAEQNYVRRRAATRQLQAENTVNNYQNQLGYMNLAGNLIQALGSLLG